MTYRNASRIASYSPAGNTASRALGARIAFYETIRKVFAKCQKSFIVLFLIQWCFPTNSVLEPTAFSSALAIRPVLVTDL